MSDQVCPKCGSSFIDSYDKEDYDGNPTTRTNCKNCGFEGVKH